VTQNDNYIAVLGDAIASRRLTPAMRAALQQRLTRTLATVNRRWRAAVAARFVIALGDQFEGLLHASAPTWTIIHYLRAELPGAEWIIACGRGPVTTPLARTAPEMDGPCFHLARAALDAARSEGQILACAGFGDAVHALALYHSALHASWTMRQRELARLLRVMEPAAAAERLDVDRSAVSHLARRMQWRLVVPADQAFRRLLEQSSLLT
jgi:hypothetical protein